MCVLYDGVRVRVRVMFYSTDTKGAAVMKTPGFGMSVVGLIEKNK